jgi:hypothetical protein
LDVLGQVKLSFGPSVVALAQPVHWTFGALVNAPGGRWTIPYGGGVGRVTRMGFQPINFSVNFYGNAVHPSGASPWGMRLQIALLFPQKPKG